MENTIAAPSDAAACKTASDLPPGVWPVMLTPFREDLSVDTEGLGKLVDFYIDAGVQGLLAACWSSETEHLEFSEVLQTVQVTVATAKGRVLVAATPHGRGNEPTLIAHMEQLRETGADIVVLMTSRIADPQESEQVLVDRLLGLAEEFTDCPLGIYESPAPYHRTLSPSALKTLAESGRFVFHKDTCCNGPLIAEKIRAIQGTPYRFYNANSPTLVDSLIQGGHGYCGVGANFYPDIYVRLCHAVANMRSLEKFLKTSDPLAGNDSYPLNAKIYLNRLGVPIKPLCRMNVSFDSNYDQKLKEISELLEDLESRYLIP